MRFLKRFFLIFAFLISAFFAIYFFQTFAFASVVDYIDLTPEQTLALYGSSIRGRYWNGSEYDALTFDYCYTFTPSTIRPMTFYPSNYVDVDYMNSRQYLVYKMDSDSTFLDDIIPESDSRVTFELIPSVSISGIAFLRQFFGFSCSPGTDLLKLDGRYNFFSSTYDYSPSPIVNYPKNWGVESNGYTYKAVRSSFMIPYDAIGLPMEGGVSPTNLTVSFAYFDLTGENLVDGLQQTFSLTAQQMNTSYLYSYGWQSDNLREHNYFIFISCPRVTDGYILPEPEHTYPSVDSQLDSLVNISTGNNTILQQILHKLDLIYQKMNQTEDVPSLQDPERIGFDSRTKQEILDGLQDGATILDSQSVPEAARNAGGAVWSASDRILSAAPGIASVYIFIFVLGIVSWVLFGKRGG